MVRFLFISFRIIRTLERKKWMDVCVQEMMILKGKIIIKNRNEVEQTNIIFFMKTKIIVILPTGVVYNIPEQ